MAPLKNHPTDQALMISCMQKIAIYETKARYYVVGSNNTETRFRVLKIDRTEPKDLHITDDKVEYTQKEIRDLLLMIDVGNRPRVQQKGSAGLSRTVSAFGIVGFVRFLEGYYVVLVTKRRRVAVVGPHTIYKIEDTSMVYIPNDTVRYSHPDEQRYVKMFQNVDLSSNFYFSYSYDITHNLQYNMSPCKGLDNLPMNQDTFSEEEIKFWHKDRKDSKVLLSPSGTDIEDANKCFKNFLEMHGSEESLNMDAQKEEALKEPVVFGVRNEPNWMWVWNKNMLKHSVKVMHHDWIMHVIHGFIGQSNICVFGRPVYLTLIARRSNQFAGTRFLKRGANKQGHVANEVESEQIVHDASFSTLESGRYTSFVQLRGSLPLLWSQDISKMMPKPPVTMDQCDPYGFIAGQHFNSVLRRYGAPIIILNLVKKREKKRHESILTEELLNVLTYLNQFLPSEHAIRYIGFDMARVSKSKDSNVLMRLAEIAECCVKRTGFFASGPTLQCNKMRENARCKGMQSLMKDGVSKQHGVVRTNCVDCLDRTNTAQFAMGKCALAFQLYFLGIIDSPVLEFDTDCVRMLEELYEDQGDTLALQYGGSQLVHRIKGYRKISPWTSSSRDIMQTLSRYYSNAFSDSDKQNALNLFLGVFKPKEGKPNIWELPTDFYLHNDVQSFLRERNYCQWWELPVVRSLPLAYDEESKGIDGRVTVIRTRAGDERVDGFWEFYKPYELTSLDEIYSFHVPNSIRDFMPKFSTSYSPFAVRIQPGRRHEESGESFVLELPFKMGYMNIGLRNKSSTAEANPNVSGKDSTASVTSTGSEGSTSSSEGSDIEGDFDEMQRNVSSSEDEGSTMVSLRDLFPTMEQTYGVTMHTPSKHDLSQYRKYVFIGNNARKEDSNSPSTVASRKGTNLIQKSTFALDSIHSVVPPTVSAQSRDIYQTYVSRGTQGARHPSKRDQKLYQHYINSKFR